MLVFELVVLLTWVSWLEGYRRNVDVSGRTIEDYSTLVDQYEKLMSPKEEGVKGDDLKDQAEVVKSNVNLHHDLDEFYYESLQEPIVETDVLVPIQREELPIPLNDRAKKRELVMDEDHHVVFEEDDEDESTRDANVKDRRRLDHNVRVEAVRASRNSGKCASRKPAYPITNCARVSRRPLEPSVLAGECVRDPPFDLSWMTCDAEIQDWAYRRNPGQSGLKTRWNGVVHVAPSPSFKQITDGFWKDQSGAGFLAMYKKVKTSYENKLEKREVCGKGEVEAQVYSKWNTLKDKVLEVRRDIRLRMIRKAELGQLPKPGMIFLRDEELISEAVELGQF